MDTCFVTASLERLLGGVACRPLPAEAQQTVVEERHIAVHLAGGILPVGEGGIDLAAQGTVLVDPITHSSVSDC